MTTVELYVQPQCKLCEDAQALLLRLRKEVPFELKKIQLTEDHPKYKEYLVRVPVVVVNGTRELAGTISEQPLREILGLVYRSTPQLLAAKFFEALGFVTVFVGFVYGVLGDIWTDLYFFLAGIAVFLIGRVREKREMKRQHLHIMSETSVPTNAPALLRNGETGKNEQGR
jgi:glutaredoxin